MKSKTLQSTIKPAVFLILFLMSFFVQAQTFQGSQVKFDNDKWNITAMVDKEFTQQEAEVFFKFIDQAFGKNLKDRYLITRTATYYRAGLSKRKPKKL